MRPADWAAMIAGYDTLFFQAALPDGPIPDEYKDPIHDGRLLDASGGGYRTLFVETKGLNPALHHSDELESAISQAVRIVTGLGVHIYLHPDLAAAYPAQHAALMGILGEWGVKPRYYDWV